MTFTFGFSVHYTLFSLSVGFGSFDTADNARTGTVFKYIRLFDLIFPFLSAGSMLFLLIFQECTVLRRTFKRKLHLTCQKKYTKRRSSRPKEIGTI